MFHGLGYDLDQQLSQLPNILQLQNIFIFPTTCGTLSIQNDINIENTRLKMYRCCQVMKQAYLDVILSCI